MMRMAQRRLALALSLAVLSGCGVFAQPSALSSKSSLVTSKAASAQAGALEVSLLTAQAQRKLLAVVADIASYRVTLTGSNINGSLVKTAPAPSNGSNKVATRFENLVPGSYTMKVEALDAAGNVIGSSTQAGVVTAGKCTYIDLNIKLSDTLVTNSKGHLGARVTIEDGNVVERPIEDCPANDGFTAIDGPCVNVTPTPSATPTPEPTPTPAPTPTPHPLTITYVGSDVDLVNWNQVAPDGKNDAHFQLSITEAGALDVSSIMILYANGYHFLDTTGWGEQLFVRKDGVFLNSSAVSNLGIIHGPTTLDIYAPNNNSLDFSPAGLLAAELKLSNGTVLKSY